MRVHSLTEKKNPNYGVVLSGKVIIRQALNHTTLFISFLASTLVQEADKNTIKFILNIESYGTDLMQCRTREYVW